MRSSDFVNHPYDYGTYGIEVSNEAFTQKQAHYSLQTVQEFCSTLPL